MTDSDYYWRVDTKNAYGTTTGVVWKLTTGAAIPVSTPAEFLAIANNVSARYFLVNDIDMVGESPVPIGTAGVPFTGIVDGGGFTVSNFVINDAAADFQGVFGVMSTDSLVYNLNVEVTITADDYVGGFVGYMVDGTISNCTVTGTLNADTNIGGFVGYIASGGSGSISGCASAVVVTSSVMVGVVGGFVGFTGDANVTINTSYATGDTTASGLASAVGGFAGRNNATINDCYATGDVTGAATAGQTGGFVGYANTSLITNSYSIGAVSTGALLGGFTGTVLNGTFSGCYYDSTTSGQSDTGKGIPKTTGDMQKMATFIGWDFDTPDTWDISEDNSYPLFETMPDAVTNPSPVNTAISVGHKGLTLSWDAATPYPAATYDVYFGTTSGALERIATDRETESITITSP